MRRETIDDLRGAPATDPRWLFICNVVGCKNLLALNEHLVCDEHPGRFAARLAAETMRDEGEKMRDKGEKKG